MHAPTPFKKNALTLAIHACCYSMLSAAPVAQAGPVGGEIVGGSGSITQSGLTTTINQASQNLATNWQSFDVNSNERVQFLQPNASAIALNRILSNNGSTIAGRIDANGKVILVNPNGIFFTPTASLNVGSIIASGLDMSPNDFMNGNYIFNEIPGSHGAVINSGMINAALGGNVALLGKQVQNTGLISATLGSVTLAAGKQAVLTFDNGGLLGVRVSEAMLQKDLGMDPAVVNSGTLQAQGGRVLLTASVSQDVFSKAVNTTGVEPATSVVVGADGTFTLGSGADVVNSGNINTSSTQANQNGGQIVLLGQNVTSSGSLHADAASGNGGEIELHAQDTTLLTQNSVTSTRAETAGQGGIVKVLGDKVGLFDQAAVDVSGAINGGQALIGGDKEGKNPAIRDATFTYLSDQSKVTADGLNTGNGGKIITFATDTARVYGNLHARGGVSGGNGGFIETSGLRGFELLNAPDVGARLGQGGLWLIDPYDLTISSSASTNINNNNPSAQASPFIATGAGANLNVNAIITALGNGNVTVQTTGTGSSGNGDITLTGTANIDYDKTGIVGATSNRTLTLNAARNITFQNGSSIFDSSTTNNSYTDILNVNLNAAGTVQIDNGASITTQSGNFTVAGASGGQSRAASFINNGSITTASATGCSNGQCKLGGAINISTLGNIVTTGLVTTGAAGNKNIYGGNGGSVTLNASNASATITTNGAINTNGGVDNYDSSSRAGTAGSVNLTATSGITLGGNVSAKGGTSARGAAGDGANISFTGPVALGAAVAVDATGATAGNIVFNNTLDNLNATPYALSLTGKDVTFNDTVGSAARLGALTINATGAVAATSSLTASALTVGQSNSFTSGDINTASTATGGAVNITSSGAVNVGAINTSGLTSGGVITVRGNQITLNGDIDTTGGGASQTVDMALTAAGSVTLNYSPDFTSLINLTGFNGAGTLNAANRVNNWNITRWDSSANFTGVLNANAAPVIPGVAFTGFSNLIGNAGTDAFVLKGSGVSGGIIDGRLGTNTLDMSALGSGATVTLDPANGNASILQVANLASIKASTITNNTLIGDNNNNTWTIDPTINVNFDGNINNTLSFKGFNTLQGGTGRDQFDVKVSGYTGTLSGGAGNDTFNIAGRVTSGLNGEDGDDVFNVTTGGSVTGMIDGGANTITGDSLNLIPGANVFIGGGATSGGFNVQNVEKISSTSGSLHAIASPSTTWTIDGVDSGTFANGSQPSMTFSGFNNLYGSNAGDTFKITGNGSVSGQITAGSATNNLTVDLTTGRQAGQVYYIGGVSGNDVVSATGTSTNVTYDPGAPYDRLTFAGTNSFLLNYNNVKTVNENVTAASLTVNGTTGIDLLAITNNTFKVNAKPLVNYSNNTSLTVDGGLTTTNQVGADVINVNSSLGVAGALTFRNAATLNLNTANTLTANELAFDQINTLPSQLNTTVSALSAMNTSSFTLNNTGAVQLKQLNLAGPLTVNAGGNITASTTPTDQRTVGGALTLSTSGDILLNTPSQNTFSGSITLTGNTINIDNNTATDLASVTAANALQITSTGNIIQTGAISAPATATIPGLTTLTTTASGSSITLTNAGNDFSSLNVSAPGAVTLNDKNRIDSGSITASSITLTTANGIGNTDAASSGNHLVTNTGKLKVDNTVNGGVYITNNGSSTVNITNVGDIELTNRGALVISRLYSNGDHIDPTPLTPYNTVTLRVENGGVQAYQAAPLYGDFPASHTALVAPDITAYKLDIQVPNGGVGNSFRRLSVKVVDTFSYLGGPGYIYYFGGEPPHIFGAQDLISFSATDALPNQQLIEIDSLGDFDPAIFTAVRNYYYEDVAIMMPADQRVDGPDEDENDKDKKKEEKKL